MRISDWSSDVCSSDLPTLRPARGTVGAGSGRSDGATSVFGAPSRSASVRTDAPPIIAAMQSARVQSHRLSDEIGRASCRERVCQYVSISVVAVLLKKKIDTKEINEREAYENMSSEIIT